MTDQRRADRNLMKLKRRKAALPGENYLQHQARIWGTETEWGPTVWGEVWQKSTWRLLVFLLTMRQKCALATKQANSKSSKAIIPL